MVISIRIIEGEAEEVIMIEVEEEAEVQVITHLIIIPSLPSNHISQVQAHLLQD